MKKYICECCGGQINRATMKCEYCGTAYAEDNRDSWEKDCYHDEAEALNIALKIIDKHISGEGDKE